LARATRIDIPPLTHYAGTFVLVCTLLLTGCGIGTPDIQEFWGTTDDADSQMQLIIEAAKCELRRATQIIVALNKEREQVQGPLLTFFNTWGADVLFQFTIDEKSGLNPVISFTPPLPSVTAHFSNGTTTNNPNSAIRVLWFWRPILNGRISAGEVTFVL
jgi:hypothetical protein